MYTSRRLIYPFSEIKAGPGVFCKENTVYFLLCVGTQVDWFWDDGEEEEFAILHDLAGQT